MNDNDNYKDIDSYSFYNSSNQYLKTHNDDKNEE